MVLAAQILREIPLDRRGEKGGLVVVETLGFALQKSMCVFLNGFSERLAASVSRFTRNNTIPPNTQMKVCNETRNKCVKFSIPHFVEVDDLAASVCHSDVISSRWRVVVA
jgi:hypothetical protein